MTDPCCAGGRPVNPYDFEPIYAALFALLDGAVADGVSLLPVAGVVTSVGGGAVVTGPAASSWGSSLPPGATPGWLPGVGSKRCVQPRRGR